MVLCGGHFGVAGRAGEFSADVLSWYDEHIKGAAIACDTQSVRLEVFGGEPGEFLEYDTWPPPAGGELELFAHPSNGGMPKLGILASSPPATTITQVSYIYDPANPTPYVGGGWLNFRKDGPKDQRSLESRDDILLFTSSTFDSAVDIVGPVRAVFHVRSSACECDFVARLCVVRAPTSWRRWNRSHGISLNLCENVTRVDFNKEGVTNGSDGFVRVEMELGGVCCRISAGDRLRLHICSGAHPKFLRHPLNPTGDWLGPCELGPAAKQELLIDPIDACVIKLPLRVPPAASLVNPIDSIAGLGCVRADERV